MQQRPELFFEIIQQFLGYFDQKKKVSWVYKNESNYE